MRRRTGNDPTRRIASVDLLSEKERQELALGARYVRSAHHKTKPGDYGFQPPVSPRPWKSICDGRRVIRHSEAQGLFREGIRFGMISASQQEGLPKYVWAVDSEEEVYEAKVSSGSKDYHGYRLEEEDSMRAMVLNEWKKRCSTS